VKRQEWLAQEFERQRPHLRGVAYRMLGSVSEAEDAVQEAWVRLDRRDPGGSDDLRGWLTVVVGRICLDMLRTRRSRREEYAGTWLPEPIVSGAVEDSPERDAVLADSVHTWPAIAGSRSGRSSATPGERPARPTRRRSLGSGRRTAS
jgi:RNA polymerase sigma factor (sigma-70 family)